ncbi:uncharacterized protein LOC129593467 [Paramacrobiotus metropolitanus]|uniref:uncharacterized protein LOC129593467 n=1 Tax=Paramacrobiotus metropolitanus TaxID=2943436 RepID=UPI0024459380|nr:uncharacterized protein LOC129593467 [Paramacrobiotus metropolitanus]
MTGPFVAAPPRVGLTRSALPSITATVDTPSAPVDDSTSASSVMSSVTGSGIVQGAAPLNPAIPMAPQTPLKPDVFRKYLASHPDRHFVNDLLQILDCGADIGFRAAHRSRITPNAQSARSHADVLTGAIHKEVMLGHTVGPFSHPPFINFVCSSLGVREKRTGGHRIILDLSRPVGDSVNDGISKEDYSLTYCSIDDAIRIIISLGPGCLLCKQDIKHAFRLVPVRPEDYHLLGFKVGKYYYFDCVLPFGSRSSPYLFCMFSYALHWIFNNLYSFEDFVHYCDDYLFVFKSPSLASKYIDLFVALTAELGIPLALDKAEGPSTKLPFLGITVDTASQTVSLPDGKLFEIVGLLNSWSARSSCTRKELQSLIGSLQFAARCVPAGRLFTRRMINLLSSGSVTGSINLCAEFHADLNWWREYLPKWNGTSSFICSDWLTSDVLNLYTDASAVTGFGGYFDGRWFCSRWPESVLKNNLCIQLLELFPILIACTIWGSHFRCRRLIFHCDNRSVVDAWKCLGSKNLTMLHLMRKLLMSAAVENFTVKIEHIDGFDNCIADALSRFQFDRFRSLVPCASLDPDPIPDLYSDLLIR